MAAVLAAEALSRLTCGMPEVFCVPGILDICRDDCLQPHDMRRKSDLSKPIFASQQGLGAPILDIPSAVAAGSFYDSPADANGQVRFGDADAALRDAPHTISNAQYAPRNIVANGR